MTEPDTTPPPEEGQRPSVKKLIPFAALVLAAAAIFLGGLDTDALWTGLKRNHDALTAQVNDHPVASVVTFIGVYALSVVLMVPGSISMMAGGFLFGPFMGPAWIAIGATIGATALFLIARGALGDWILDRAGPRIHALKEGFERNAFNYMLFLRFVGMTPFFFQNIAPAFFGVRVAPYAIACLIGVLPWAIVFATIGDGLGDVIAAGEEPDLSLVLDPQILIPITTLGFMSLAPVIYRHRKAKQAATSANP